MSSNDEFSANPPWREQRDGHDGDDDSVASLDWDMELRSNITETSFANLVDGRQNDEAVEPRVKAKDYDTDEEEENFITASVKAGIMNVEDVPEGVPPEKYYSDKAKDCRDLYHRLKYVEIPKDEPVEQRRDTTTESLPDVDSDGREDRTRQDQSWGSLPGGTPPQKKNFMVTRNGDPLECKDSSSPSSTSSLTSSRKRKNLDSPSSPPSKRRILDSDAPCSPRARHLHFPHSPSSLSSRKRENDGSTDEDSSPPRRRRLSSTPSPLSSATNGGPSPVTAADDTLAGSSITVPAVYQDELVTSSVSALSSDPDMDGSFTGVFSPLAEDRQPVHLVSSQSSASVVSSFSKPSLHAGRRSSSPSPATDGSSANSQAEPSTSSSSEVPSNSSSSVVSVSSSSSSSSSLASPSLKQQVKQMLVEINEQLNEATDRLLSRETRPRRSVKRMTDDNKKVLDSVNRVTRIRTALRRIETELNGQSKKTKRSDEAISDEADKVLTNAEWAIIALRNSFL